MSVGIIVCLKRKCFSVDLCRSAQSGLYRPDSDKNELNCFYSLQIRTEWQNKPLLSEKSLGKSALYNLSG